MVPPDGWAWPTEGDKVEVAEAGEWRDALVKVVLADGWFNTAGDTGGAWVEWTTEGVEWRREGRGRRVEGAATGRGRTGEVGATGEAEAAEGARNATAAEEGEVIVLDAWEVEEGGGGGGETDGEGGGGGEGRAKGQGQATRAEKGGGGMPMQKMQERRWMREMAPWIRGMAEALRERTEERRELHQARARECRNNKAKNITM